MPLFVAGQLKSELPGVSPGDRPQPPPAKVIKNCTRFLDLETGEGLILIFDETVLGSGKQAVVVTDRRLLSYDKSKLRLNLGYRGLAGVDYAELEYDSHGLAIRRSAGRSLKLRLAHATATEARIMAMEIAARLDRDTAGVATWVCPRCGPGEVLYLPRVELALEADRRVAATDLQVCRRCGHAALEVTGAAEIAVGGLPGAELR